MDAWLKTFWKKEQPSCKVKFSELSENPPHRILGCTLKEYFLSLDSFRNSSEGSRIMPRPEVLAWFQHHGDRFENHIITARPQATVAAAAEWVFRHFGTWVRHFHYTPAVRDRTDILERIFCKGDVIRKLGGGYAIIDDSPQQLESAGNHVCHKILVPQPWNQQRRPLEDCLEKLNCGEF